MASFKAKTIHRDISPPPPSPPIHQVFILLLYIRPHAGRNRGIRVIPEFDTPGHVNSWGWAFPSILANCSKAASQILDVSNNETYSVLWKVLRQAAIDFPDQFCHLGGDEVDYNCWKNDPAVSKWMKEKGLKNGKEVQFYHTRRMLILAKIVGKQGMLWQEAADEKYIRMLPKETVVQVWKWDPDLDQNSAGLQTGLATDEYWLSELSRISKTHRTVLSAPWYLNLAAGGDQNAWRKFWEVDPLRFDGSADQRRNVIGGEACLWGEMVDETNALQKTWPLAATVAERLWSIENDWNSNDTLERLEAFRCRLVFQGIDASPLRPGYCHPYYQP